MKSIPRNKEHPIIMLNPGQGPIKNTDGKFVFVGKVYGTPSINENPEKVQALLRIFPRLNADELRAAADGIYTWLLYSVDGFLDEIRIVCTEVVSPFEIGTRHQSLAHNSRINAVKVYGGGELIKSGPTIQFNLLSGTYSKALIGFNFDKSITKDMITCFKTFFPDAQYDNTMDSYVHRIHTVSNELLGVYREYGYTVRIFDTENDRVTFSNTFWNLDFNIEYYKKEFLTASSGKKAIMTQLYMEALERMIKLLEEGPKLG